MHYRAGGEHIKGYPTSFPAYDQAPVLALELRTRPLGLEAREGLSDRALPLHWSWRTQIGKERPLQTAEPFERSSHCTLRKN
jgi:hypothetical protein